MSYIARKKCSFGGVDYVVGDSIPHDVVMPGRVRSLVKSGIIVESGSDLERIRTEISESAAPLKVAIVGTGGLMKVLIPILATEGIMQLEVSPEEVTGYFGIVQMNAEEAIETIKTVDSQDVLIMLDALDQRKTVKTAAKARAEQLIELEAENATADVVESENIQSDTESNETEMKEPHEGGEA